MESSSCSLQLSQYGVAPISAHAIKGGLNRCEIDSGCPGWLCWALCRSPPSEKEKHQVNSSIYWTWLTISLALPRDSTICWHSFRLRMVKSLSLSSSSMLSVLYMFSSNSRCISSFVNLKNVSGGANKHGGCQYSLNEVKHNSLRDHVDHGALHNIKVRLDKQLCCEVSKASYGRSSGNTH
jgi:hypothetical protein